MQQDVVHSAACRVVGEKGGMCLGKKSGRWKKNQVQCITALKQCKWGKKTVHTFRTADVFVLTRSKMLK